MANEKNVMSKDDILEGMTEILMENLAHVSDDKCIEMANNILTFCENCGISYE